MHTEITISLDENDFLAYQLYTSSTSKRLRLRRKREWIFTTVIFLCLALVFYLDHNTFLLVYCLAFAAVTALTFPFYSRWRYKNFYLRHVREHSRNSFGTRSTLVITDEQLELHNDSGRSTMNLDQITEVNETGAHYFLKLSSGQSIIVPKAHLEHPEEWQRTMEEVVAKLNIAHHRNPDWKWK